MCQTNTLFDWTCSDKINTVFPRKEVQAPPISYRGLFVVKIQHKRNRQPQIRTRSLIVEDYQAYQTHHLDHCMSCVIHSYLFEGGASAEANNYIHALFIVTEIDQLISIAVIQILWHAHALHHGGE